MSQRKRFKTLRALVHVTGSVPQNIIPAESGIAPAILQIAITNRNGDLRAVRLAVGTDEFHTLGIGASGSIIWDMMDQEELPQNSGFYASLDAGLGLGDVEIQARYVRYDVKQPINLDPATYRPSTIRTPNKFGRQ